MRGFLMYILILLLAGCGLIFPEDEDTTTSNSAPTADTPTDNTTKNTPTCQIASNSFEVVGGERAGQDWEGLGVHRLSQGLHLRGDLRSHGGNIIQFQNEG